MNDSFDVTVTGIMVDVPIHSHFQFDYLMPILVFKEAFRINMDDWGNFSFGTYVLLAKNVLYRDVEQKMTGLIKEHFPESGKTLHLQPVIRIHLHELGGGGLIVYIYHISPGRFRLAHSLYQLYESFKCAVSTAGTGDRDPAGCRSQPKGPQ